MEPITLTEGAYYKLKARMLELSIQQQQIAELNEAARTLTDLVARKRVMAYQDAGLDPALGYSMDDTTLSVIEKVSENATL